MTQNTLPSPPARQRISWLLALPKFGIVLLMLALMALLWLLQHSEKEEQRNLLIKDVLWLEQNLRFHMEGNRDLLQQIAVDMSDSEDKGNLFRVRSAHLLKNSPEISQIRWLDKAQKTRFRCPPISPLNRPCCPIQQGPSTPPNGLGNPLTVRPISTKPVRGRSRCTSRFSNLAN